MNKRQAGRLGGLETVRKYGIEHMRRIGKKGARATWSKYKLAPVGTSDFAMVERATGKIVALTTGRSLT